MSFSDSVDEELTQSKLNFIQTHSLEFKATKNLFQVTPELSAIEPQDSTQRLLYSKSSSNSVFDRLAVDANRRTNASKKIKDFRIMAELEYEKSFLSPSRLTFSSESSLVSRLMEDSTRRRSNKETIEYFKNITQPKPKWPLRMTEEVVKRLNVDKRSKILSREEARKNNEETNINLFQKIREQKHPKRKLSKAVTQRVTNRAPCTCAKVQEPRKPKRSWEEIQESVQRLHKKSPLRIVLNRTDGKIINLAGPGKDGNLEVDDYLISLKARGQ